MLSLLKKLSSTVIFVAFIKDPKANGFSVPLGSRYVYWSHGRGLGRQGFTHHDLELEAKEPQGLLGLGHPGPLDVPDPWRRKKWSPSKYRWITNSDQLSLILKK